MYNLTDLVVQFAVALPTGVKVVCSITTPRATFHCIIFVGSVYLSKYDFGQNTVRSWAENGVGAGIDPMIPGLAGSLLLSVLQFKHF